MFLKGNVSIDITHVEHWDCCGYSFPWRYAINGVNRKLLDVSLYAVDNAYETEYRSMVVVVW